MYSLFSMNPSHLRPDFHLYGHEAIENESTVSSDREYTFTLQRFTFTTARRTSERASRYLLDWIDLCLDGLRFEGSKSTQRT